MDDKKKIVLGSEDFLAKRTEDIFININLQQTFNQIKKDKYDNNFDLAEQFRKERNASRDFRLYGIVDSTIADTDNLNINVFKDSGLTQVHSNIVSTPLVYEEDNVFNKKRGKFLLELNNYDSDLMYLQILGDNISYADQVFEQRLVFYTLDGEFVEYGTETVDIGFNTPGFLEIENDFPFLYNKHWVKKNLEILEEKPTVIQFGTEASTVLEGDSIEFSIEMDKPSPFGNEAVVLDAIIGTVLPADFNVSISGSPVNFPIVLTWAQGEQNKTFTFDAIDDDVYEFSETMRFNLSNFQFTSSGLTDTHFVTIEDATERKTTKYHLGEIYKNRTQFTGRTVLNISSVLETSAYSILRNGLHFENKNEAFYPGDTYQLYVTNKGVDTILPINSSFGIGAEELWIANTEKAFNIDTQYNGYEKHKVRMIFPQGVTANKGKLRINGVSHPLIAAELSYSSVSQRILDTSSGDWLTVNGYEKDWSATADVGFSSITITSKTVGLPVKIDIQTTAGGGLVTNPIIPGASPIVLDIDPFVEREQIPKILSLYANEAGNATTLYEFNFVKQGFVGASVSATTHPATTAGTNRYLVSTLDKVSRNWDDVADDCVYVSAATPYIGHHLTELGGGIPFTGIVNGVPNYFWPVGTAHINGSVMLSKNNLPISRQNFTDYLTSDFKPFPLLVEECTTAVLSPLSVSQKTKVAIPLVGSGNESMRQLLVTNANSFRSFDFRTGTTGTYTTFHKSNNSFFTSGDIKWGALINVSGATTTTGFLSHHLDYGNLPSINVGSVLGLDINDVHIPFNNPATHFWLESKTPGVPFEIVNIVDAYVHTTASNVYGQQVVAGEIVGPITIETFVHSSIAGIGENVAKNWMNGYNTDLVLGVGGPFVPLLPPSTSPPLTL